MQKSYKLLALGLGALLAACQQSIPEPPQEIIPPPSLGYLKLDISQAELSNATNYKRYYYTCRNLETNEDAFLSTYFPLWKESRLPDNFGIYFQLNNGKAEPFDHVENKSLNARATKFEVIYRSYQPIEGYAVELIARENSSTYYKNRNGSRTPWLKCREA